MRDWAVETALQASKAGGTTRLALALVAGHWSNGARTSRPGTRRIAELSACSQSSASRRLARLVASGDLVVVERGRGKRATRYSIPALDDAIVRGSLAFRSEDSLRPYVSPPGGLTNAHGFLLDPVVSHFDPVVSHSRSALEDSEVGSNEVDLRATRAEGESSAHVYRTADGISTVRYDDEGRRIDDVERPTITDADRRRGRSRALRNSGTGSRDATVRNDLAPCHRARSSRSSS